MFDNKSLADPWIYYKMMHVKRAQTALALSYDLGLYKLLEAGPKAPSEVAEGLGLQVRPATVMLAANACMGVLGVNRGKYFVNEPLKEFAFEKGLGFAHAKGMARADQAYFDSLKNCVLTNRPDPKFAPDWVKDPDGSKGAQVFDIPRDGFRMMWGMALADAFDFSPYKVVADLGGATGGVLSGLTRKCPNLKGLVVELPYSKAGAVSCIADAGAADMVGFYEADIFKDPLPAQADVMFMSHVLHDWDDESCLVILRRCYEALPKGCPVIAQEFLLNEDKTGSFLAVFQWVGMLVWTMGEQRTAAEISSLMAKAGFRDMETRPVDSELSIVIGWKK
ncbi:MAG: methyltransferase [Kiritimatiellae bacterium]|nr:methyltransferase [Kiritimatiellia bacterium]